MDSFANPYAPGAGALPPELAGRDELRREVAVNLSRVQQGRAARGTVLVGLRGVGKTVLLEQLRIDAEANHAYSVRLEAEDTRSLPAALAPRIRSVLLKLSRVEAARSLAIRGLRALAGFAKGLKLTYQDIELTLDQEPETGLADYGNLEIDLSALLEELGGAAKSAGRLVVLFIDEMQYIPEDQLSALISALHRCSQDRLPVVLVGAGLPQIRALAGNAKSYAERLFDFRAVDPLSVEQARLAITKPAATEGATFSDDAVESIIHQTLGYPYFVQEWCRCSWDVAPRSPITLEDVNLGSLKATAMLDESFFSVRFHRVTPRERDFLRAMAELGPGPHLYADVISILRDKDSALEDCREQLVRKGMIWESSYNRLAFTTPLFDDFMKRRIPSSEWKPKDRS